MRYLSMRKILVMAYAMIIALILLWPAMGFSVHAGNHSYTLKSTRLYFTMGIEPPSHEPRVIVNRGAYSIKYDNLFQPAAKQFGETAKSIVIGKSTSAHMSGHVQAKTRNALAEQGKLFIHGMVFNDKNGNGKMDENETGVAGWKVNLQLPSGNSILNSITNNSGEFSFDELIAGKYILAIVQNLGWSITAPPDGRYGVNLTDNVTGLNFGGEITY
jgi:uncharacterized protein (DUF2141 family)